MFVFVRQDLPIEHQFVQALHAVYQLAAIYAPGQGIPNIILIGLPDIKGLKRVLAKLKHNRIPHYEWHEPDNDFGFTAIATIPLDEEQRKVLKNYRLFKFNSGAGLSQGECSVFNDNPGANLWAGGESNLAVSTQVESEASPPGLGSSEKEHFVFNEEDAGSSPAPVSNFGAHSSTDRASVSNTEGAGLSPVAHSIFD